HQTEIASNDAHGMTHNSVAWRGRRCSRRIEEQTSRRPQRGKDEGRARNQGQNRHETNANTAIDKAKKSQHRHTSMTLQEPRQACPSQNALDNIGHLTTNRMLAINVTMPRPV